MYAPDPRDSRVHIELALVVAAVLLGLAAAPMRIAVSFVLAPALMSAEAASAASWVSVAVTTPACWWVAWRMWNAGQFSARAAVVGLAGWLVLLGSVLIWWLR